MTDEQIEAAERWTIAEAAAWDRYAAWALAFFLPEGGRTEVGDITEKAVLLAADTADLLLEKRRERFKPRVRPSPYQTLSR